ncbi:MAG: cyclic nucleotide-binding domain-containing protein [Leptospirales bacterium]
MATTIKIAKTPETIDEVFKVRHKVFHEEEKLLEKDPTGRLMDRFDAFPTTSNLVVEKEGNVVGSLRLSIDSEVGLPADEYFDFRPHISGESLIMHCGMFCVSDAYRTPKITTGLMLMATYFGISNGVTHVVAPINPAIARLLKRVGYEQVGEEFTEPHMNARMIPLMLDARNLSDFFIHFVEENQLQDYIGEYERSFYEVDEYVIRGGERGQRAYIIIEGDVDVRLPGTSTIVDTLTKGDVFGELALLFNEPRTADIIATTPLQVMALTKKSFDQMFFQDPNKTLNLIKTLGKRNKKLLSKLRHLQVKE